MTRSDEHLTPQDEADLAALADGCLHGPCRAELEARIAADPVLAAALETQRTAMALIAASSVPAPLPLRLRVEEMEATRAAKRVRRPLRRRALPAAALAFAATLAALVVLIGGGPAIDDVLAVALRPATAPASLERDFEGIRFPTYEKWRATGSRTDEIDGRRVRTVFYERDGRTIAYAIVSGPALSDDGALKTVRDGDRVAVTWTRRGHTCMIAGPVEPETLAKLAVW